MLTREFETDKSYLNLVDAMLVARQSQKGLTAAILATIGSLCGSAGGSWSAVKSDEITATVLSDLGDWLAYALLAVGDSDDMPSFAKSLPILVKRALGKWGVNPKVSVVFRRATDNAKSQQALKFEPQITLSVPEFEFPLTIGVSVTFAEKKETNPLSDESDIRADVEAAHEAKEVEAFTARKAEIDAQAADATRLADAIKVATQAARDSARGLISDDAARETCALFVDHLTDIALANVDTLSDAQLIAELKARGYKVSKVKATA